MLYGGRAKYWWVAIWMVALGTISLLGGTAMAAAVSAPPASGFALSPAFVPVEVRTDQSSVSYSLKLTNHNATDQNFRLSAVDFGSLNETGGVAFLGAPTSELDHRYGLASWMTLEKDALFVPAGQSAPVTITINNRPSLAPGGHYGAVLVTAVTDTGQPVADPRVGVKQVLAGLILVTKDGGIERNLKLVSQTANAQFWRLPTTVEQRFQNAGNVHLVPRGVVEVRDPRGVVVERVAINDGSTVILPESFRRYTSAFLRVRAALLPGRYTVVSTYRYDGTDQTKQLVSGFWYVGSAIAWLMGALVVLAVALLGWWLWWWRPRHPRRGRRWQFWRR